MVGKDSIPSFWPGSFKDSSKGAWTIGDSTQYSVYTVLECKKEHDNTCLSTSVLLVTLLSFPISSFDLSLSLCAISTIANSALSSTCHLRYGWHHECVSWHHVLLCVHVFSSQCHCQISPTYWVKNTEASEWFHMMMFRNSASFNQLAEKKFHRPLQALVSYVCSGLTSMQPAVLLCIVPCHQGRDTTWYNNVFQVWGKKTCELASVSSSSFFLPDFSPFQSMYIQ